MGRRRNPNEPVTITAGEWRWLRQGIVLAVVMAYIALVLATITAGLVWSALSGPPAI